MKWFKNTYTDQELDNINSTANNIQKAENEARKNAEKTCCHKYKSEGEALGGGEEFICVLCNKRRVINTYKYNG